MLLIANYIYPAIVISPAGKPLAVLQFNYYMKKNN